MSPIEQLFADWRADAASVGDALVTYRTGKRHFGGETTVRVGGDGEAEVIFARGNDEQRYRRKLDENQLRQFVAGLAEHRIWALASTQEFGTAGESKIHLHVRAPGRGVDHAVTMWANEQHRVADLKAIVQSFKALMRDVSDGKVTF